MALYKQNVFIRVDTAGDILSKLNKRALTQQCGILTDGYCVHIGYAVYAVVIALKRRPVAYGSDVRTERQLTGGLYARKNCFFIF